MSSFGDVFFRVTVEQFLGRDLNGFERNFAPKYLYVAGRIPLPVKGSKIAVVGTRSPQNAKLCQELVRKLVKRGVVIVSGLARGIDTIAHKTAIECGGKTIAVLPTSITSCYPPENASLLDVIKRDHLAVSQFPIGYPLRRENFLLRNKTIALISDAVVIVEAGERSGTISVGWACIRLNKPLYGHDQLLRWDWFRKMVLRGAKVFKDIDELVEALTDLKHIKPSGEI